MVSQGSYCDEDGVPGYMQDFSDEDSIGKIKSRREVEDFPVPIPSSSGGIGIDKQDLVSSEDEGCGFEDDRAALERETVNRVAKAAFDINRDERLELIDLRKRFMSIQAMLEKKGISLASLEKEQLEETAKFNTGLPNHSSFITGRDEYGLPIFSKLFPDAGKVFEGMPEPKEVKKSDGGTSGAKNEQGLPINDSYPSSQIPDISVKEQVVKTQAKSWSNVVKESPPQSVSLEYVPLNGASVIPPPPKRNCYQVMTNLRIVL